MQTLPRPACSCALFVSNFRDIDVLAAANDALSPFDQEEPSQRHRLQILDFHALGESNYRTKFVHLAHSFVEDSGDDAPVRVSGWSLIPAGEAKTAPGAAIVLIKGELQPHP